MSFGNKIDRHAFLKLVGVGTAGLLMPINLAGCGRSNKTYEILVPKIEGLNYWEMLMFSCLQGLTNREKPRVFLYFPDKTSESWDSGQGEEKKRIYYEWYKKYTFLQFSEIGDPYNLFEELKNEGHPFEGYVMVDPALPITANIAANYASTKNLLPVTPFILEDQKAHLPDVSVKRDLRGQFGKMDKLEVYEWAYEHQWPQANHACTANLGTPDPAPADQLPVNSFYVSNRARDYTVAERGLFFDLNSKGDDYKLKDQILNEMEPQGYVLGWHQQAGETQHISQLSRHGQLALGASTYSANYSFYSRVKVPGAVQRFRHQVISNRAEDTVPDNKIYLTFALSDGDSLNFISRKTLGGQWQLNQRGEIPFGWELQPLLADIAPGILDYFQATATPNDYFVDGVSGIGYFYPEEMPKEVLRNVLTKAKSYLERTGQSVLTVMGPRNAVSEETAQIYQNILGEQLTGIMEGYTRRKAQAVRLYRDKEGGYTSWLPTSNPRGNETVENWVKGLKKVAQTRTQRPLFIPIHVPAHQLTIADMKELMDGLGDEFEAVSPDSFYKRFAEARRDEVVLNPPESFPAEPTTLQSGTMNTLNPTIQNYSESPKEITVSLWIASEALDTDIRRSGKVSLQGQKTADHKFQVQIPKKLKNKDGQLAYKVNGKPSVSIPVNFS